MDKYISTHVFSTPEATYVDGERGQFEEQLFVGASIETKELVAISKPANTRDGLLFSTVSDGAVQQRRPTQSNRRNQQLHVKRRRGRRRVENACKSFGTNINIYVLCPNRHMTIDRRQDVCPYLLDGDRGQQTHAAKSQRSWQRATAAVKLEQVM